MVTEPSATTKTKSAVAATGIRDAATMSVMNFMIELGKTLQKRDATSPALSEQEIKQRLAQELDEHLAREPINTLLGMPRVNIHLDMPTEILHTVLLGVVKYFWGQTVWLMDKNKTMSMFHSRLSSLNTDSLNAPSLNADYICKYRGSLIGKHFKSLAQLMPFLVYDIVPGQVLDAWNAIGSLVVLLWHTEILDLEVYLVSFSL